MTDDAKEINAEEIISETTDEKSEVEILNEKISEMNDKYLRLAAELENTRRRASLDIESVSRGRAMSIAEKFLPLVDAINAATLHHPDDEGIKILLKASESVLAQIGITKIETVGQQLNPTFHNAISIVEMPQSDEPCSIKNIPNTIVGEMLAGYMFGDTVLRPAMVSVCK